MNMTGNHPYMFELPSESGLRAAQEIAASLRNAIAANGAVTIATKAVTSADLTTIQVLLAAKKLADNLGKSLSLAATPQGALGALLIELGFLDPSGVPLTEGGSFWTSTTPAKGKAQ